MSSDAALESIMTAIDSIKTEVAGLASKLQAAEGRIDRLEAATYTPTTSPSSADRYPEALRRHSSTDAPELAVSSSKVPPQNDNAGEIQSNRGEDRRHCLRPIDLQQQLQPINNGIATLTKHLLRIEDSIAGINPASASNRASNTQASQEKEATSDKTSDPHAASTQLRTNPRETRKSGLSPGQPKLLPSLHPTPPRPVFGTPSTPSTHLLPLHISGSPFGNYVDEQSPFSQLGKKSTNRSSTSHSPFTFGSNDSVDASSKPLPSVVPKSSLGTFSTPPVIKPTLFSTPSSIGSSMFATRPSLSSSSKSQFSLGT